MKLSYQIEEGVKYRLPLLLVLLFSMVLPLSVHAGGGLALSGSFYQQAFEIPQGSSASGPSVYVMVFNNGDEEINVRMSSQTPVGVSVTLSTTDFKIPPMGQQQVMVEVAVTQYAASGEYEISVTAESYKEGSTGIQLAGAASQRAKLTVLGESALVSIQAASPDGTPLVGTLRLYRILGNQDLEIAYSETGKLEVKVAPGNFVVVSYIGGEKVAEESFTVAANDHKTITLSGKTVYFQGFGQVPNYRKSDGKLAFAEIVYSIKNLYQSVPKAEVFLEVNLNGTLAEEFSLATLSPLELGSKEFSYRYIPAEGWQDGDYTFKLRLEIDGKTYTTSPVEQVAVSGGMAVDTTPEGTGAPSISKTASPTVNANEGTGQEGEGGGGMGAGVIIGIAAAVLVLGGVGFFFLRKKKA